MFIATKSTVNWTPEESPILKAIALGPLYAVRIAFMDAKSMFVSCPAQPIDI